jgi:hypothetical protein
VSIALTAIAFGAFGLLLLVRPETLAVVGVQIARPAGAVELRGFYGGLELGLAVFFALALGRPTWHVPALVLQLGALGGAVAGRLVGLVVDGGWEPWIAALLIAEAGGAAMGALALAGLKRHRTSGIPTARRRSR